MRPQQRFTLGLTGLTGVMYPLSHDRYPSSMLLISNGSEVLRLLPAIPGRIRWNGRAISIPSGALGPLVEQKKLKGMIIETSYPNGVEDKHLYGHLTPAWLLKG